MSGRVDYGEISIVPSDTGRSLGKEDLTVLLVTTIRYHSHSIPKDASGRGCHLRCHDKYH